MEALLRIVGFGYPTAYFVPSATDPRRLVENPAFGRRFFPAGLLRVPPPTTFRRHKAAGTIRVFVFGESAAMGDPKPAYGVARYLEVLLQERHPGTDFEVIPAAMTAINSHALLPMARQCAELEGDYWIVFAGNNEMLGPFGAGSTLGGRAPPWRLVRLILAARASRLGQAIEVLAGRLRSTPVGSSRWAGVRVLAGDRVSGDSPERARVYTSFQRNLDDLTRAGQAAGARVLLSSVAVNLRDSAPFGSAQRSDFPEERRADWNRFLADGVQALTNGQPAAALPSFEQAAALDAGHAELEFLLARADFGLTNLVRARERFERSRDLDTIPLRTDSRLNEIIRQTAAARGATMVDAAGALSAQAAAGAAGREAFYEHVHLTPEGNYALARVFAASIEESLPAEARSQSPADWASPEACATRLALTPWNRAAAFELMLRRCLDAPFTNRWNQEEQVRFLAQTIADQRRAQLPASVPFLRDLYTQAITNAPGDHHLHRGYAEFLEAIGDLPAAALEWQRIIELLPHHPVAYLQAGSLLRRARKTDEARPLVERAVILQPDWIEARLELADLFLARGRPAEAIEACRAALRLQPDHARAHLRLADALAADRQRDAAILSLEEAVRFDPRLWEARYLLGVEYALLADEASRKEEPEAARQRLEAAREQFTEVIRLKPDHARARFNLGIALARLRLWDEAAVQLGETLRLDPQNAAARQALAQVNAQRQRPPATPPSSAPVASPPGIQTP